MSLYHRWAMYQCTTLTLWWASHSFYIPRSLLWMSNTRPSLIECQSGVLWPVSSWLYLASVASHITRTSSCKRIQGGPNSTKLWPRKTRWFKYNCKTDSSTVWETAATVTGTGMETNTNSQKLGGSLASEDMLRPPTIFDNHNNLYIYI